MSPSKPYLLRALHEWISDNGQTPLIVVDAEQEGVEVPFEFVEDGKLVLNVSVSATGDLELGNEHVSFSARFGGTPHSLWIPVASVLGIYSRESGQGMVFPEGDEFDDDAMGDAGGEELNLSIVESSPNDADADPVDAPDVVADRSFDGPVVVQDNDSESPDDDPLPPKPTGTKKPRPSHLKVVK